MQQKRQGRQGQPAYRSVKGQDEAALGIILCGGAVAPVPPALQVLKAVVGVMQHSSLLTCLLSANAVAKV